MVLRFSLFLHAGFLAALGALTVGAWAAPSAAVAEEPRNWGFALGAGDAGPFWDFGIEGLRIAPERDLWSLGLGRADTKTSGLYEDTYYRIPYRATGISGGFRHFLTPALPLYVYFGPGIGHLMGEVSAQRAGLGDETTFAFSSYALFASAWVGIAHRFDGGFYADFVIRGLTRRFLVSSSTSRSLTAAEREVLADGLETGSTFGLFNLKVGWIFR